MQSKTDYIQSHINRDFCLKSRNAGLAQMVAAIIFIFVHFNADNKHWLINLAIFNIVAATILRTHYLKIHLRSNTLDHVFLKKIDFILVFTSLNWSILATKMIQSNPIINHELIITLVLIVNFNIGSILSLAPRYKTIMSYNLLMLFPLVYFAIKESYVTGDKNILWLISYCLINLIYISKQSRLITQEMTTKFSNEFELINSLKEIESSKKNLEEEAMRTFHASRLSSLGEMAGGVAHEINNPLTIIQATSKSILGHGSEHLDEGIKNKINKIYSASERIAKIVRGMKNVASKNDKQEHELTCVNQILDISFSLFEERLKNENVNVLIDNQNGANVFCNQLQISQIIINLISNALDEVSKYETNKFLHILVNEDNDQVQIRVLNTGDLLTDDIMNKIFEPFFTTKQIGKGTGLGLSISKTLAQNNRGDLQYENYQDKICFKLTLNKK